MVASLLEPLATAPCYSPLLHLLRLVGPVQQHRLQRVGGAEDLLLRERGEVHYEGQRLGRDEALKRGQVSQRACSG